MTEHNLKDYINENLTRRKWEAIDLANESGINPSDISKYRKGTVKKLKADVFYKIYSSFNDTCGNASKIVYPNLNFKLNKYKSKERNDFGRFMQQFEESTNSIEEISVKTGIDENRLKDLYFRRAAIEAHELLLIEKAIVKNQGELFEKFFGRI